MTRSGIERSRFMIQRTGVTTQTGAMLRAAARPSGTARKTARKVPHSAIWIVSHIWPTNSRQLAKSGRSRSAANRRVFSALVTSSDRLPRSTSPML